MPVSRNPMGNPGGVAVVDAATNRVLRNINMIDPQWKAILDRAARGGPGSSPKKPLYIAFRGR